ncbi:MAG: maleylpyruvate isomerase N-terminal domain-containing protein [Chloroflexia bacterium]|nr:maleylpyruvate isomerase N-terminal domain-containing protein [Chloroflexia bacterium]
MSGSTDQPLTAAAVRARNAELDDELARLAARVTPGQLHVASEAGEWTLAETLAHVAEFARYFAGDLARQLGTDGGDVGRTHDHPRRNQAIAAAAGRDLAELRGDLNLALDELAKMLESLHDEHLGRIGNNRKYGPETLAVFLDRYVLDHKVAHIDQLRRTLDRQDLSGLVAYT